MTLESEKRGKDRVVPTGKPPRGFRREQLPAIEVDNEVVWVNEEMRLPFRIQLGERCNLGMFLVKGKTDPGENVFPLTMMTGANRSALLGRVVYEDAQGRTYRDTNLKGAGGSGRSGKKGRYRVYGSKTETLGTGSYGICNWGYAERDRDRTEFFLRKGLRTHRTVAILRLKEIVTGKGERITIEEAKRKKYIGQHEEPVIQIRAYGTQARIENAEEEKFAHLKDAMQMVAQELGKETITPREYMHWFAKTLGEQVAILHTHGHSHRYLTKHNITLDCRLTDFDSVGRFNEEPGTEVFQARKDLRHAFASFVKLRGAALKLWTEEYASKLGEEAYAAQRGELIDWEDKFSSLFFDAYRRRLNRRTLTSNVEFMSWLESEADT